LERRRQRKAKARRRLRFALLICGLIAGVGMFVLVGWAVRKAGPIGFSNGEDWTHREMAEYLRRHGLQCEMTSSKHAGRAYLFRPNVGAEYARAISDEEVYADGVVWFDKEMQNPFTKESGAEFARRIVGEHTPGSPIFNWGPWVFRGDRKMLAQIKSILGVKD
jgi:hypothetical protein